MKTKSKAEYSRSANMRAIKGRNTSPELLVRKIARTISTGYRLHRKDIPGKPDLAWIGRRKAVFVNGCFWHGHDCKHGARVPKENRDYWTAKIGRNRARDSENLRKLEAIGWSALTLWECELGDETQVRSRLSAFLSAH
ncbi:MAG: very short patch repair endonuclease [Rhizobiaceae bacterium]